jgi:hypothetical protein
MAGLAGSSRPVDAADAAGLRKEKGRLRPPSPVERVHDGVIG